MRVRGGRVGVHRGLPALLRRVGRRGRIARRCQRCACEPLHLCDPCRRRRGAAEQVVLRHRGGDILASQRQIGQRAPDGDRALPIGRGAERGAVRLGGAQRVAGGLARRADPLPRQGVQLGRQRQIRGVARLGFGPAALPSQRLAEQEGGRDAMGVGDWRGRHQFRQHGRGFGRRVVAQVAQAQSIAGLSRIGGNRAVGCDRGELAAGRGAVADRLEIAAERQSRRGRGRRASRERCSGGKRRGNRQRRRGCKRRRDSRGLGGRHRRRGWAGYRRGRVASGRSGSRSSDRSDGRRGSEGGDEGRRGRRHHGRRRWLLSAASGQRECNDQEQDGVPGKQKVTSMIRGEGSLPR